MAILSEFYNIRQLLHQKFKRCSTFTPWRAGSKSVYVLGDRMLVLISASRHPIVTLLWLLLFTIGVIQPFIYFPLTAHVKGLDTIVFTDISLGTPILAVIGLAFVATLLRHSIVYVLLLLGLLLLLMVPVSLALDGSDDIGQYLSESGQRTFIEGLLREQHDFYAPVEAGYQPISSMTSIEEQVHLIIQLVGYGWYLCLICIVFWLIYCAGTVHKHTNNLVSRASRNATIGVILAFLGYAAVTLLYSGYDHARAEYRLTVNDPAGSVRLLERALASNPAIKHSDSFNFTIWRALSLSSNGSDELVDIGKRLGMSGSVHEQYVAHYDLNVPEHRDTPLVSSLYSYFRHQVEEQGLQTIYELIRQEHWLAGKQRLSPILELTPNHAALYSLLIIDLELNEFTEGMQIAKTLNSTLSNQTYKNLTKCFEGEFQNEAAQIRKARLAYFECMGDQKANTWASKGLSGV